MPVRNSKRMEARSPERVEVRSSERVETRSPQRVEAHSPERTESGAPEQTHRASDQIYQEPKLTYDEPESAYQVPVPSAMDIEKVPQHPEELRRSMQRALQVAGHRIPKSTQSMPEPRSPPGKKGLNALSPRSNVDPVGKAASGKVSRAQTLRGQLFRADKTKADAKAAAKAAKIPRPPPIKKNKKAADPTKREVLLRKQMREQIDKQQSREQQSQRVQKERALLEQQLMKARRKKLSSKNEDRYDQYTGAESTSGFSRYSDKYKVVSKPTVERGPGEPRVKIQPELDTGAHLGTGQFATNVGVLAGTRSVGGLAAIGNIGGPVGARSVGAVPVRSSDVKVTQSATQPVVSETCPDDMLESLIMPPAPPTEAEQQLITSGMQSMALASGKAVDNDDCGAFFPIQDEPSQPVDANGNDWYGKEQTMTQETFVGDLLHSLWTCS